MANHQIRLKNEDLIRLIIQINEKIEANTVDELITALENGEELGLNIVLRTSLKIS
jgi:hypothetical protein